jgi:hypothetical protein
MRIGIVAALLLASASAACAQVNELSLSAPPPPPVSAVSAVSLGPRGGTRIWYWVVARYPVGSSAPSTAAAAENTTGSATLSVSNSVVVTWSPAPGATGYDVLRSDTPSYPANPTCTCAVVLNTSSTSVTDNGSALSAYPPGGLGSAGSVAASVSIANRDASVPFLVWRLNTQIAWPPSSTFAGLPSASAYPNLLWVITDAPSAGSCASGGGSSRSLCRSNGTTWESIGGGGGGGGVLDCGANGVMVRTALNTTACRTLTSSDSSITWVNPSGVAAAPDAVVNFGMAQSRDRDMRGDDQTYVDVGGDDAYVVNPASGTVCTALVDGMRVYLRVTTTNTGTATVDVCGLGAKSIVRHDGSALVDGDIGTGRFWILIYVAASDHFRLLPLGGGASTTTTYRRYRSANPASSGVTAAGDGFSFQSSTVATFNAAAFDNYPTIQIPETAGAGVFLTDQIPPNWTGGNVTFSVEWAWDGAGNGVIALNIRTGCQATNEAFPTFNAAQVLVTTAASASGRLNVDTLGSALTMTGCAAGELLIIDIDRDAAHASDGTSSAFQLYGARLSFPVTL